MNDAELKAKLAEYATPDKSIDTNRSTVKLLQEIVELLTQIRDK